MAAEASCGVGRHRWQKWRSPTNGVEILMEMERFNGKAKEGEQGAVALVLDLAKAFEKVGLPMVWALATNLLQFPKKDIAGVVWLLRAPEASTV